MVRKGSPVRVRQRASKNPPQTAGFFVPEPTTPTRHFASRVLSASNSRTRTLRPHPKRVLATLDVRVERAGLAQRALALRSVGPDFPERQASDLVRTRLDLQLGHGLARVGQLAL